MSVISPVPNLPPLASLGLLETSQQQCGPSEIARFRSWARSSPDERLFGRLEENCSGAFQGPTHHSCAHQGWNSDSTSQAESPIHPAGFRLCNHESDLLRDLRGTVDSVKDTLKTHKSALVQVSNDMIKFCEVSSSLDIRVNQIAGKVDDLTSMATEISTTMRQDRNVVYDEKETALFQTSCILNDALSGFEKRLINLVGTHATSIQHSLQSWEKHLREDLADQANSPESCVPNIPRQHVEEDELRNRWQPYLDEKIRLSNECITTSLKDHIDDKLRLFDQRLSMLANVQELVASNVSRIGEDFRNCIYTDDEISKDCSTSEGSGQRPVPKTKGNHEQSEGPMEGFSGHPDTVAEIQGEGDGMDAVCAGEITPNMCHLENPGSSHPAQRSGLSGDLKMSGVIVYINQPPSNPVVATTMARASENELIPSPMISQSSTLVDIPLYKDLLGNDPPLQNCSLDDQVEDQPRLPVSLRLQPHQDSLGPSLSSLHFHSRDPKEDIATASRLIMQFRKDKAESLAKRHRLSLVGKTRAGHDGMVYGIESDGEQTKKGIEDSMTVDQHDFVHQSDRKMRHTDIGSIVSAGNLTACDKDAVDAEQLPNNVATAELSVHSENMTEPSQVAMQQARATKRRRVIDDNLEQLLQHGFDDNTIISSKARLDETLIESSKQVKSSMSLTTNKDDSSRTVELEAGRRDLWQREQKKKDKGSKRWGDENSSKKASAEQARKGLVGKKQIKKGSRKRGGPSRVRPPHKTQTAVTKADSGAGNANRTKQGKKRKLRDTNNRGEWVQHYQQERG